MVCKDTIFEAEKQVRNQADSGAKSGAKCGLDYKFRHDEPKRLKTKCGDRSCNRRGCPECGRRLMWSYVFHFEKYFNRDEAGKGVAMTATMGVTHANMKGFARRLKRLDKSMKYVYVFERGQNGKLHLHCAIKSKISLNAIRKEWEAVAVGRGNRFRDISHAKGWLRYMFKGCFNMGEVPNVVSAKSLFELRCSREIAYRLKKSVRARREYRILNDTAIQAEIERLTNIGSVLGMS